MNLVLLVASPAAVIAVAAIVPTVSRRRNRRRADREGALWMGLANIDADDHSQAEIVRTALRDVKVLRGRARRLLGPRGHIAGRLSVFAEHVVWDPSTLLANALLGRGTPRSWKLPREAIVKVSVMKQPWPAVRSWTATLETVEGRVTLTTADPAGLTAAFDDPGPVQN